MTQKAEPLEEVNPESLLSVTETENCEQADEGALLVLSRDAALGRVVDADGTTHAEGHAQVQLQREHVRRGDTPQDRARSETDTASDTEIDLQKQKELLQRIDQVISQNEAIVWGNQVEDAMDNEDTVVDTIEEELERVYKHSQVPKKSLGVQVDNSEVEALRAQVDTLRFENMALKKELQKRNNSSKIFANM